MSTVFQFCFDAMTVDQIEQHHWPTSVSEPGQNDPTRVPPGDLRDPPHEDGHRRGARLQDSSYGVSWNPDDYGSRDGPPVTSPRIILHVDVGLAHALAARHDLQQDLTSVGCHHTDLDQSLGHHLEEVPRVSDPPEVVAASVALQRRGTGERRQIAFRHLAEEVRVADDACWMYELTIFEHL